MPCVSSALDLLSDDEVPIPRLYFPSTHATAESLADSTTEVLVPTFAPSCSGFMS
jgi:hypothetical protein